MKPQFKHLLTSSFMQWFEYTLLTEGECYTNFSGKFYEMTSARKGTVFALPYGQIVHDSSITGATIPSGVYVNSSFVPRGTNNLRLDFQNGQIMMDPIAGANVTGSFAVKEFDLFYTNRAEDELVLSSQFSIKSKSVQPFTGRAENETLAPAIFISKVTASDEAFEFGGADNSINHYRALILATDDAQLDGLDSIFTEKSSTNFAYISSTPWNEYGDLKSGRYNYLEAVAAEQPNRLVFISDASFTKFSATANKAINPKLKLGVLEFTLEIVR